MRGEGGGVIWSSGGRRRLEEFLFLGEETKQRWRFCEIQIFLLKGASR